MGGAFVVEGRVLLVVTGGCGEDKLAVLDGRGPQLVTVSTVIVGQVTLEVGGVLGVAREGGHKLTGWHTHTQEQNN